MKYKVKVLQEREVEAGNVFCLRRDGNKTLAMLVPVPLEDGAYTVAASRWILVSLDLFSATWSHEFHDSPEEALAGAPWEFYAESPEEAFKRKRKRVKK